VKSFFALASCLALCGCVSLTPVAYTVKPQTRDALAKFAGKPLRLVAVEPPAQFDPMCRAVGEIPIAGGLGVAEFVAKAFNDEFRFAGIHSESGTAIRGRLVRAAFSSSAAVVNGWWDLAVVLESDSGSRLAVEVRHEFHAGFGGFTACNQTGRALAEATSLLVRKAVDDPAFGSLAR